MNFKQKNRKNGINIVIFIILIAAVLFYGCKDLENEPPIDDVHFYFGTYNGWTIMANVGPDTAIGVIDVVGFVFYFPSVPVDMFAWRNGNIFDIQEAVERGFITNDNVKTMHERHNRGETHRF